jgi:exoribonuclease-2
MESGIVIEYIDRQRILCAVILEVKNQKLRILTENNREVSLAPARLSHCSRTRLDPTVGRNRMVALLKDLASRRDALMRQVDIHALWEVLNTEQEWIDLPTMTAFCFDGEPNSDHESAVLRAFFGNRLYFKFNHDAFYPHSEAQVERLVRQQQEAARRERAIQDAGDWLRRVAEGDRAPAPPAPEAGAPTVGEILQSSYIFGKDSPHHELAKAICQRANVDSNDRFFELLVKAGIFDLHVNTDLVREGVPLEFPAEVLQAAERAVQTPSVFADPVPRRDLTDLNLMTIDGQATLDFDDALSLEERGDHTLLGIHIVDVAHYVRKGDPIDREALRRASSIYLPDGKLPMLPPQLAEGLCSLKAGELRPAVSTLVTLSPANQILSYEVVPSLIRVRQQRTYYDVNLVSEVDPVILRLRAIAAQFRQIRLDQRAVQISLPDVSVWLGDNGEINVSRVNRESPARYLVSELMIMGNWLMARFLRDNAMPAVFRAQPDPKERLYAREEGTLFQNWMQRRLLSRFVLDTQAGWHSGLGLDAYVTATSPIRKYYDLVTQRQIRAALGLEASYTVEEVSRLLQLLEEPMGAVSRIQHNRQLYWLLRHLETRVGAREEAIVLARRRNGYQILLTAYMLECDLPLTAGLSLKPETVIEVTIQNVNARKGTLAVFTS